jgi:mannose-6-phosphate isomerase-like protein (cupin superfamily)
LLNHESDLMHIKNTAHILPFESAHGEIVYEYMGKAAGGTAQHSLAQIILPPGKAALKHYHPAAEESYYILSGKGRVVLDGEERIMTAGDAVAIPANTVHRIFNDSKENLVFLAICAPPWTPDCSVFVP